MFLYCLPMLFAAVSQCSRWHRDRVQQYGSLQYTMGGINSRALGLHHGKHNPSYQYLSFP